MHYLNNTLIIVVLKCTVELLILLLDWMLLYYCKGMPNLMCFYARERQTEGRKRSGCQKVSPNCH